MCLRTKRMKLAASHAHNLALTHAVHHCVRSFGHVRPRIFRDTFLTKLKLPSFSLCLLSLSYLKNKQFSPSTKPKNVFLKPSTRREKRGGEGDVKVELSKHKQSDFSVWLVWRSRRSNDRLWQVWTREKHDEIRLGEEKKDENRTTYLSRLSHCFVCCSARAGQDSEQLLLILFVWSWAARPRLITRDFTTIPTCRREKTPDTAKRSSLARRRWQRLVARALCAASIMRASDWSVPFELASHLATFSFLFTPGFCSCCHWGWK